MGGPARILLRQAQCMGWGAQHRAAAQRRHAARQRGRAGGQAGRRPYVQAAAPPLTDCASASVLCACLGLPGMVLQTGSFLAWICSTLRTQPASSCRMRWAGGQGEAAEAAGAAVAAQMGPAEPPNSPSPSLVADALFLPSFRCCRRCWRAFGSRRPGRPTTWWTSTSRPWSSS